MSTKYPTNTNIRYTGQVNQAGTSSTTFVIPENSFFRGYISGSLDTGGNVVTVVAPIIKLRQNNVSGVVVAMAGPDYSSGASGSDNAPRTVVASMYVELGQGTYFVQGLLTGNAPLSPGVLQTVHVCGVILKNT